MTQKLLVALDPYVDQGIRKLEEIKGQLMLTLGWDGRDCRLRLDNVNNNGGCDVDLDEDVQLE